MMRVIRANICLLLLGVMVFILSLDTTGIVNSIFTIKRDLHLSTAMIQWIISIYSLTISALILVGGIVFDRLPYKVIFILSVLLFLVASIFIATSTNIYTFLLARLLQGIGVSFIMPSSLAILNYVYHEQKFGMAVGIWSGTSILGAAVGPIVAGYVIHTLSWRALFWLNVPFCLIVAIGCYFILPHKEIDIEQKPISKFDLALLVLSLFLFFIPTIQGNTLGWLNYKTLLFFALSILLLSFFSYRQLHENRPVIDFTLFKARRFTISVIGMLTNAIMLMLILFFFNKFIQHPLTFNFSPQTAGFMLLPLGLSLFVMSLLISTITDYFGFRFSLCIGMILWIISFLVFYFSRSITGNFLLFLLPLILAGIATGICYSSFPKLGISLVPQKQSGEASGLIVMANYLGSALAISLGGIVYSQTYHYREFLPVRSLEILSFSNIMILGMIIAGLSLILCFFYLKDNSTS